MTQDLASPRPPRARRITRRQFLAGTAALGGAGAVLAARPRPARAQGALKGTKLTIVTSDWYVPETNKMLDDLAASMSKDTGMEVKVERFAGEQHVAKVAAIVGSGQGADLALVRDFDAYLYADKLIDVTDLAAEVGKTYGGWFDVAQQACVVKGRWKALMIGQAPAAWNYRTDMFKAAGVERFPDTFDELLAAARKLHAKGTPVGMTLGHASGDGRSTNYPVLWAFGGKEFEADGKTVAINSAETLRAVEWYVEMYKYMVPGVTAWLDPDNNQAFLAGKVSATVNVNTIYLAARTARRPTRPRRRSSTTWTTRTGRRGRPAGSGTTTSTCGPASPPARTARASSRSCARGTTGASSRWTKAGQSYFIPPFGGFDKEDVWPDDPKLKIFRELNKLNRLAGYAGPPTPAAAEAVNKFVLVNMFAKAATGQMKPIDAVKWAQKEYKQIAQKRLG